MCASFTLSQCFSFFPQTNWKVSLAKARSADMVRFSLSQLQKPWRLFASCCPDRSSISDDCEICPSLCTQVKQNSVHAIIIISLCNSLSHHYLWPKFKPSSASDSSPGVYLDSTGLYHIVIKQYICQSCSRSEHLANVTWHTITMFLFVCAIQNFLFYLNRNNPWEKYSSVIHRKSMKEINVGTYIYMQFHIEICASS